MEDIITWKQAFVIFLFLGVVLSSFIDGESEEYFYNFQEQYIEQNGGVVVSIDEDESQLLKYMFPHIYFSGWFNAFGKTLLLDDGFSIPQVEYSWRTLLILILSLMYLWFFLRKIKNLKNFKKANGIIYLMISISLLSYFSSLGYNIEHFYLYLVWGLNFLVYIFLVLMKKKEDSNGIVVHIARGFVFLISLQYLLFFTLLLPVFIFKLIVSAVVITLLVFLFFILMISFIKGG